MYKLCMFALSQHYHVVYEHMMILLRLVGIVDVGVESVVTVLAVIKLFVVIFGSIFNGAELIGSRTACNSSRVHCIIVGETLAIAEETGDGDSDDDEDDAENVLAECA